MKKQEIRLMTGNTLLDMVVGGAPNVYGYSVGKFINIVGDKSSGKTFIANEIIANTYHNNSRKQFKWIYDDCEAGYSFDSVKMYGFDIIPKDKEGNPINPSSTTVQEAFVNIYNFANSLKGDQFGIYVLDSLDGLSSNEENEQAQERIKAHNAGKTYDKGTYGMDKAKYLSKEFFRQLCSKIQDKNVLVIIISQVRQNIEPFSFDKYVRAGGKAMDFYAHTVLWLATLKKINKKGKPVGVVIKAKTTKSKTPRPFRDCLFSIIFDYGVDNIGSNLDYLYELRTDKGELTPTAKSIAWGDNVETKKHTVSELKKWLMTIEMATKTNKGKNKKQNALEVYLQDGEKPKLNLLIDFIESVPQLKDLYNEEFGGENGKTFTREALIEYIENNSLEKELANKVIEKWERIETDISSKRKKRYATQPKGGE